MKCKHCGKPMKENMDGNNRYCQGHYAVELLRDLVNEPERIIDDDLREKTLFEARELINKADRG